MTSRVVITGAGGLVGSYAASILSEHGFQVGALYRRLEVPAVNFGWDVLLGDLRNTTTIYELEKTEPDVIVHCAAELPDQFTGYNATKAAEVNRAIDMQIAKLCSDINCRLVYLSSMSVYGFLKGSIVTEEAELSPMGPYAAAKAESEREMMAQMPNRSIILRISSPYGPGQRKVNVLRSFVERALVSLDLLYYGKGSRQQDFISAVDVGDAILRSVTMVHANGIFNVASGNPISMRDLAELVVRTVPGSRSRVVASQQSDPQEEYRALFDIRKVLMTLGWFPSVRLEDGIRSYAEHLKASKAN